jgi:hypothetical protein
MCMKLRGQRPDHKAPAIKLASICILLRAYESSCLRVRALAYDGTALPAASAAALRRQSRHRQSSPSTGIGRRAVSSAHQHGPGMPQLKAAPHREQASRRPVGFSNQFVTNRTEP